jgi:hypothetical protein
MVQGFNGENFFKNEFLDTVFWSRVSFIRHYNCPEPKYCYGSGSGSGTLIENIVMLHHRKIHLSKAKRKEAYS